MGFFLLILGIKHIYVIEPRKDSRIDALSIVMAFFGLGAFMIGIGEVFRNPGPSSIVIIIGFVLLILFNVRQLKIKTPLLDLTPLKHPRYTIGIILIMVAMMSEMALAVLVPLYMEGALGLTSALAGLLIVGPVICDTIASIIGGKVADKHGTWPILPIGFILLAGGIIGVWLFAATANLWGIIACAGATFAGIGFIVAPDKRGSIGVLPQDEIAFGSSIESVSVQVANSIGSALFVGILSADVVQQTARGMTRANAYSFGFMHTVLIGAVIGVIGLIIAFFYARHMHKDRLKKEVQANQGS